MPCGQEIRNKSRHFWPTHSEIANHQTISFWYFPVTDGIFPALLRFFRQMRSRCSCLVPMVLHQNPAKLARISVFWQNPLQLWNACFGVLFRGSLSVSQLRVVVLLGPVCEVLVCLLDGIFCNHLLSWLFRTFVCRR